ncbi:hypothetical protein SSX86_026635 [Deinandra increscens subsp. villosa]|uniref:Arf-GAP domain-containing protein n=1 Tax=Deinandra increscens subsp. villosa TaxID=3103831 RepID=A0AAP0CGA2_9ASTR
MSSRKEEERNEKIIRGLMKLPPNRRCINCNSLGPQYVCTNFWTFVCMTCSGIHREFTHRVKSVSMSKFTSQEVEALQEGGNQRARETFLRDWDPREQRLPDNSNVDKVRDFIKSVYVDKKFFASKTSGKPPRDTLSNRNHEDETRRASSYHSYSQSPPYDYQYEERRYGKQAPALTKKPGSDRGMLRFLSTSRLSDHVQEDKFANEVANARVSDYSVTNGGDISRSDSQSPPSLSHSSGSAKFDGLDLFSAPNPLQSTTSAPSSEPEKFGGLDLFSAPNPPPSTSAPCADPKKFAGLDLFSAPNPPPSALSTQPGSIDASVPPTLSVNPEFKAFEPDLGLFTVIPQKQLTETSNDKSTDMITPKNDGWATFDMPWHAQPSQQDISATAPSSSMQWHGAVHDIGDPVNVNNNNNNNQQSWSSFEESTTPFESIYTKNSEQVPVQDPLVANPFLAWGIPENFKMKEAVFDTGFAPFVSTTPHPIGSLDSSTELPNLDGAWSHGLDTKSHNPFDFPSDTDLESSNMFFDMSSLQSTLPNHNMSMPWFPDSAAQPFTPGKSQEALVFLAGQAPSMQIPNIQAPGPVASVGGNPFG